ncbi:MAG: metallopeptidase family protein [Phycisphaerae bacterium]|nr:metallopeptidase family protein [Phycisphaerae bacterium]
MSAQVSAAERARFDSLLERVLAQLPPRILAMLDESPLVVDDAASRELLQEMGMDPNEDDLCGLHTGVAKTDRSVLDSGQLPDTIQLFRRGIIDQAGGWDVWTDEEGNPCGGEDAVAREIRITLLHEIGHHFGLEEEDLRRLGYE